jgi:hypothetical protein
MGEELQEHKELKLNIQLVGKTFVMKIKSYASSNFLLPFPPSSPSGRAPWRFIPESLSQDSVHWGRPIPYTKTGGTLR